MRFREVTSTILRLSIQTIGQHYEQSLRCRGDGATPGSLTAETPAQEQVTKTARDAAIDNVVQGVAEEIVKEKKRLEAKRMPIDPKAKKDPPPLPKADPAPLNIKTKGLRNS